MIMMVMIMVMIMLAIVMGAIVVFSYLNFTKRNRT